MYKGLICLLLACQPVCAMRRHPKGEMLFCHTMLNKSHIEIIEELASTLTKKELKKYLKQYFSEPEHIKQHKALFAAFGFFDILEKHGLGFKPIICGCNKCDSCKTFDLTCLTLNRHTIKKFFSFRCNYQYLMNKKMIARKIHLLLYNAAIRGKIKLFSYLAKNLEKHNAIEILCSIDTSKISLNKTTKKAEIANGDFNIIEPSLYLYIAARYNHKKLVEYICQNTYLRKYMRKNAGKTALQIAAYKKHGEVFTYLHKKCNPVGAFISQLLCKET